MLTRMILAAAAVALATPAIAACIETADDPWCDLFAEDERIATVPFGSTMVWPDYPFLLEEIERPGIGAGVENLIGEDVLYWDGDDAFVVPGESGPQIKIADW